MKGLAAHKKVVITATVLIIITSILLIRSSTSLFGEDALDLTPQSINLDAKDQKQQKDLQRCATVRAESECPSYFAWIHEDLAPWSDQGGISRQSIDQAIQKGDFRIVIAGGKLYHQRYHECIQTRDEYTLRSLLLLLDKFPGGVPDVEMVFVCNDFPQVPKAEFQDGSTPPPVFSYCTSRRGDHFDILFPDWSFWGWPEVRIRPWIEESKDIFQGSSSKDWLHREPIAYWKGNLWVMTPVREELLACNNTQYNVVVYYLDWGKEAEEGFHTSALSQQCHTRYKVYAEGRGWSASLKYIMACGSTVIHIEPDFWEFFARSWIPYVHYWPVTRDQLCSSIKFAVDWGNAHPTEAEAIGKCGKKFVETEVTMDHVYSYMLHLIRAYAKLQRFRPAAPEGLQPLTLTPEVRSEYEGSVKVCDMPPRDKASISRILESQAAGYKTRPDL